MKTSKRTVFCATIALAMMATTATAQDSMVGIDLDFYTLAHSEGQTVGFGFSPSVDLWGKFGTSSGAVFGVNLFLLDSTSADLTTRYDRIVMQSLDLTAGRDFDIGSNIMGTVYAGIGFTKYREEERTSAGYLEIPVAMGPKVGVDMQMDVGGGFTLYGASAASLQYAPQVFENGILADTSFIFNTVDVDMGVQYGGTMGSGKQWFGRAGIGGKLWNGVSDNDSENTAAVGLKVSFGMNF